MTEFPDIGIEPYYEDKWHRIYLGDCRSIALSLSGVSAVVTDPPYELGFMGKSWDSQGVSFQPLTWEVIKKACVSGAPLLSFGGTRTQHRIACAIEDAGWDIRDCVIWVYGSGIPKSLDISKAIDKSAGVEREVIGKYKTPEGNQVLSTYNNWQDSHIQEGIQERRVPDITAPATTEAQLWSGYGTALKPAFEPIILAMNPLDGTFANNALKHGVAGLNINGCRVEYQSEQDRDSAKWGHQTGNVNDYSKGVGAMGGKNVLASTRSRFPANLIHDGSDEIVELFPQSKGQCGDVTGKEKSVPAKNTYGEYGRVGFGKRTGGNGSAARFFYCAKVSKSERGNGNSHATVKPLSLMEYLCKLVRMPEHNLILDPFMGSGTTLLACGNLGIKSIGIDSDEKSCEIAKQRCIASCVKMAQSGTY